MRRAENEEGWIVITGAGGGLGRALAVEFAREGRWILSTDLDQEQAAETARLAGAAGAGRSVSAQCDVTKAADFGSLLTILSGDPVAMLVNNAGVACGGYIGEIPAEDWRWCWEHNFAGTVNGCHAFVPVLREQGWGHIVNIASAGGFLNLPESAPYNASKAAVIALTETLSAELAGSGVRATVVCPVFFRSEIAKKGRMTGDNVGNAARKLVEQGRSSENIARRIASSLHRHGVVLLPEPEGRWLQRIKRFFPRTYLRLVILAARRFRK